ncbi:MAG TPA: CcdB family protein [Rhizomicrobium sp.]|jgi:toxin CcdB|nr:CcdB family protein [Rhizomicrobium sp.]
MAIEQFDVFHNPLRGGRDQRPYVITIQHLFLRDLPTCVIVPLVVPEALHIQPRLNPALDVNGRKLHLSPTEPFALSTRLLSKPIANLAADRDRIVAALDMVFTGI